MLVFGKEEIQLYGLTANLAMMIVPCLPDRLPPLPGDGRISSFHKFSFFFFFYYYLNFWSACCHIKALKMIGSGTERGN
jgi:hypothetical protein